MSKKNKEFILRYWKSWQEKDWGTLRVSLADTFDFGGIKTNADEFTEMCKNGSTWSDVQLFESFFTEEGGALLYEGTDIKSGARIRVGEFIRIENGKVVATNSCFGHGMPG